MDERLEEVAHDLPSLHRPVWALAWSPDGTLLLSGNRAGWLAEWDVPTGELKSRAFAHEGGVCALASSPRGALVASGGGDDAVRLWAPATGQKMQLPLGHSAAVRTLAWSSSGAMLASAGDDGTRALSGIALRGRCLFRRATTLKYTVWPGGLAAPS